MSYNPMPKIGQINLMEIDDKLWNQRQLHCAQCLSWACPPPPPPTHPRARGRADAEMPHASRDLVDAIFCGARTSSPVC